MKSSDDERPVETVVAELREGMVQQRALLAGIQEKAGLQELEQKCHIDEPVAVPPARLRFLGGVIVWLRKAVYHGVIKWSVRPARFRQNEFNRAVTRRIAEMAELERGLERRLDELERRLKERD